MTQEKTHDNMDAHWLNQSIIVLKGIGEKMLERFAKRSLFTLNDLLFHLPVRYQDKTRVVPISTLRVNTLERNIFADSIISFKNILLVVIYFFSIFQ